MCLRSMCLASCGPRIESKLGSAPTACSPATRDLPLRSRGWPPSQTTCVCGDVFAPASGPSSSAVSQSVTVCPAWKKSPSLLLNSQNLLSALVLQLSLSVLRLCYTFPSHFFIWKIISSERASLAIQAKRHLFCSLLQHPDLSFTSYSKHYNHVFFTCFQFLKWMNKHHHFYTENYLP